MLQPFAHQTFRCPRCGSGAGVACRCCEPQTQTPIPQIDFPKLQPPVVLRAIELNLAPPSELTRKR